MVEQKVDDAETKHEHDHEHHHDYSHEIDDLGPCKKLLRINYEAEKVRKKIDDTYRHLKKTVHLKGFRKGKVPRRHLERLFGKDVLQQVEAELIQESVEHTLGHEDFELIAQPEPTDIKFDKDVGLSFEVTLMLRPLFELPDYQSLKVTVPPVKVTDEDVDRVLAEQNREKGSWVALDDDASIEEGDKLDCKAEVWLINELEAASASEDEEHNFKPLKTHDSVEVLVSEEDVQMVAGIVVKALADDVLGLEIGEVCDVDVELPHDYEVGEGQGQAAVLRLHINSAKRLKVPEGDDELTGDDESLEDLRSKIRNDLLDIESSRQEQKIGDEIVSELLRQTGNFDLPTDLVDAEHNKLKQRYAFECHQKGMSEEQVAKELYDKEDELRVDAMNDLRRFFLLDNLCKKEDVRVSDDEVRNMIFQFARQTGQPLQNLMNENAISELRWQLQESKVLKFLRGNTEVTEGSA